MLDAMTKCDAAVTSYAILEELDNTHIMIDATEAADLVSKAVQIVFAYEWQMNDKPFRAAEVYWKTAKWVSGLFPSSSRGFNFAVLREALRAEGLYSGYDDPHIDEDCEVTEEDGIMVALYMCCHKIIRSENLLGSVILMSVILDVYLNFGLGSPPVGLQLDMIAMLSMEKRVKPLLSHAEFKSASCDDQEFLKFHLPDASAIVSVALLGRYIDEWLSSADVIDIKMAVYTCCGILEGTTDRIAQVQIITMIFGAIFSARKVMSGGDAAELFYYFFDGLEALVLKPQNGTDAFDRKDHITILLDTIELASLLKYNLFSCCISKIVENFKSIVGDLREDKDLAIAVIFGRHLLDCWAVDRRNTVRHGQLFVIVCRPRAGL
jgi:hypothetical protein